jgi:hypothetical protein
MNIRVKNTLIKHQMLEKKDKPVIKFTFKRKTHVTELDSTEKCLQGIRLQDSSQECTK